MSPVARIRIALVLVVTVALAACGSSGGSSSAGTTTTTAAAAGDTRPELLRDVPEPVITVAYLLQDELDGLGYDVAGQVSGGQPGDAEIAAGQHPSR